MRLERSSPSRSIGRLLMQSLMSPIRFLPRRTEAATSF